MRSRTGLDWVTAQNSKLRMTHPAKSGVRYSIRRIAILPPTVAPLRLCWQLA
jgi:hypothetical protein